MNFDANLVRAIEPIIKKWGISGFAGLVLIAGTGVPCVMHSDPWAQRIGAMSVLFEIVAFSLVISYSILKNAANDNCSALQHSEFLHDVVQLENGKMKAEGRLSDLLGLPSDTVKEIVNDLQKCARH